MSDPSKLPLVFLYTNNRESIGGATKFQKLVFLAQEEEILSEQYKFEAHKYGPFSKDLHRDLHTLQAQGLLEIEEVQNEVGQTRQIFRVTHEGIEEVQKLLRIGSNEKVFDTVQDLKRKYNDRSLPRLLQYVYQNYDQYITETEVDTNRLFDPEAESEFLDPPENDYVGSEPGDFKKKNLRAQELFSIHESND